MLKAVVKLSCAAQQNGLEFGSINEAKDSDSQISNLLFNEIAKIRHEEMLRCFLRGCDLAKRVKHGVLRQQLLSLCGHLRKYVRQLGCQSETMNDRHHSG